MNKSDPPFACGDLVSYWDAAGGRWDGGSVINCGSQTACVTCHTYSGPGWRFVPVVQLVPGYRQANAPGPAAEDR